MSVYGQRGRLVRLLYLATACAAWVWQRVTRRGPRLPIVLCYHNVRPVQSAQFEQQLNRIVSQRSGGTANDIAVTFDDAFADLLFNALPALVARSIPFTVFAVTGSNGRLPHWNIASDHVDAKCRTMISAELRAVAQLPGAMIGAHTVNHPDLTTVDGSTAIDEMLRSREALERSLQRPVLDFAFPHGRWTAPLLAAARAVGFERLYVLDAPSGPKVIRRMRMDPDVWPLEFRLTIDGAYDWLPRFRRAVHALLKRRTLGTSAPAPTSIPLIRESQAHDERPRRAA